MEKVIVRLNWNTLTVMACVALVANSLVNAEANDASGLPEAHFTAEGAERCLECHGGEKMTAIADSPHGNTENPYTPYAQHDCEACHGKGSLHVSRARGGAGFPLLIQFKRGGATVEQQNQACLNCHASDMDGLEGMAWSGSLHDTGRMTCGTCHTIHTTENEMAGQAEQVAVCSRCHEEQISAHPKFEDKSIVFDKLSCGDCHDVHQLERKPE